jgi:hypothetical protein
MATLTDVIPIIVRQTPAAQAVLNGLYGFFYAASLNGTHLAQNQPADAGEVRHHMHERADFLNPENGPQITPGYSKLRESFLQTHWTEADQVRVLHAARNAMNGVINRSIHGGLSWTNNQRFREEASAEAALAAAHALGMN